MRKVWLVLTYTVRLLYIDRCLNKAGMQYVYNDYRTGVIVFCTLRGVLKRIRPVLYYLVINDR